MPNCIYAIIYAYYKEDEYTSNPDIYQIVLHDLIPSRHPTIDIEPSCTPIYVSIYDNRKKSLFDASMNAAANQLEFFEFKNENGILNQFIILEVKQLDQALVAKYKSPIHINFGRKKPVITFYLRSNKCFREKHHCTPCRARINPKEKYRDFTDPIVIDIIRCDRCEKYFVTKEMFASKGGHGVTIFKVNMTRQYKNLTNMIFALDITIAPCRKPLIIFRSIRTSTAMDTVLRNQPPSVRLY